MLTLSTLYEYNYMTAEYKNFISFEYILSSEFLYLVSTCKSFANFKIKQYIKWKMI